MSQGPRESELGSDPRFAIRASWRALRWLEGLPVLRSPALRRALRTERQRFRRARRRLFEARGDDRYSRPALNDMEHKLAPYLPPTGFFVEAGAYDGFTQSNTYHLERFRGWSGLLVEAIPELYRAAAIERPASRVVNCALVGPDRAGDRVRIHHAGPMSIIDGARGDRGADEEYLALTAEFPFAAERYEVEVVGRTLSELLDEMTAPPVDFLSLDVEGYEAEVLAGLDLERHAPRHMLIEAHDEIARSKVEARLNGYYRLLKRISQLDYLYERLD